MSFTVAPLTATVMGAVSDRFSGTASGINNAMTRISGVFANAIFGALAVWFFAGTLQQQLHHLQLNPQQQQEVIAQAADLGNAKVPAGVARSIQPQVETLYHQGFIHAYTSITRLSSGLAFLSALVAMAFIRSNIRNKS